MSAALLLTALFLAIFGVVFVALGLSNERAYWRQRDPAGRPQGASLADITKRTWFYAVHGRRPSLRVAAIGIVLLWVALALAVLGVVARLLGLIARRGRRAWILTGGPCGYSRR